MGRKRTIDRDALMDGVESVARREGVSGLSIDALAKEVGISKSSVVYDCGSKAGLLAAFAFTALIYRVGRSNGRLRVALDVALLASVLLQVGAW
mgnify:CR=1 FL=1